jgi:hypothetical protein
MQLELNVIQLNLILIQTPNLNSNTLNEIHIQFNSNSIKFKFKLNWIQIPKLRWIELNTIFFSFGFNMGSVFNGISIELNLVKGKCSFAFSYPCN